MCAVVCEGCWVLGFDGARSGVKWVKSIWRTASLCGLYLSFIHCTHASRKVVPDATKDARFAGNPLVVNSPNIRFYAGVQVG
jgi:hypothetical protein